MPDEGVDEGIDPRLGEAHPKGPPVPPLDRDGRRDVVHELAGVAPVELDEDLLAGVLGRLEAHRIVEEALGAVAHLVLLGIPGQGLGELGVVGGDVAVAVGGDGEEDVLVLDEGVLEGQKSLVGEGVEARAVLLGLDARDRDVVLVEGVVEGQGLGADPVLDQLGRDGGALAREPPALADEVGLDGARRVVDDHGGEAAQQYDEGRDQRAGDLEGEARLDLSEHAGSFRSGGTPPRRAALVATSSKLSRSPAYTLKRPLRK
ncbi:hypothetical protein D3C86_1091320 [compost metagenome]